VLKGLGIDLSNARTQVIQSLSEMVIDKQPSSDTLRSFLKKLINPFPKFSY
jgi:hypothetical protein